jgi:transcriptional regulator with XRE-family HTH domain
MHLALIHDDRQGLIKMNLDDKRFLRELGKRVREHRRNRKWTQAELAHRCSLHRTFIGSIERGERNLSILNLRLISRTLRISLSDLFTDLA